MGTVEFSPRLDLGIEPREKERMQFLSRLQNDFNRTLHLPYDSSDLLNRSFNPVTDRWHVEMLRAEGNVDGLQAFRHELRLNQRTDLLERYHAVESYGQFDIINGHLYSPEFPDAPFTEVLERGVRLRQERGSLENDRENAELIGWEKMHKVLVDPKTSVSTTFISLSPPSSVGEGSYKGRFVDKYAVAVDDAGKRYIKRARIAVDWDSNEYKNAAVSLDPNLAVGQGEKLIDAFLLENPIQTDKDLIPKSMHGMTTRDFDFIYGDFVVQHMITLYEGLIYAKNVDWVEVSLTTNAIRNHMDALKKALVGGAITAGKKYYKDEAIDSRMFQAYVYQQGMKQVESVGGGGCPANKGINMKNLFGASAITSGYELFSNSVAKFLNPDQQEWFTCPKCSYKADGPVGDQCPECKVTMEEWTKQAAEEGAIVCA